MGFWDFFRTLFGRVFAAAKKAGLTDEMIVAARDKALEAAITYADNSARRTFVIAYLKGRFGIPESLANFVLEAAIQLIKGEGLKS